MQIQVEFLLMMLVPRANVKLMQFHYLEIKVLMNMIGMKWDCENPKR